jgi:hypothetical protein
MLPLLNFCLFQTLYFLLGLTFRSSCSIGRRRRRRRHPEEWLAFEPAESKDGSKLSLNPHIDGTTAKPRNFLPFYDIKVQGSGNLDIAVMLLV